MKRPLRSRPLLSSSVGLASITLSACLRTSGNLMPPPPCPEGQVHATWNECADTCPPGTIVLHPIDDGYDYCETDPDAGLDASSDASTDASTDAGVPDAGDGS